MSVTKKHAAGNKKRKKSIPPVVVVTNTLVSAAENPFPEKLIKAQEILKKTKFLDR